MDKVAPKQHVWKRVRRSFKRSGEAFDKTFKSEWPDGKKKEDDKLDMKDAAATAGYTGLGAAAGAATGAAIGFNPVVGAALGGGSVLYQKAKEFRKNYNSIKDDVEAEEYLEYIAGETNIPAEEWLEIFNEATQADVEKLRLFNAILDQKPHDAKEAMNTITQNKLEFNVADYKSDLAQSMFNGAEQPSLKRVWTDVSDPPAETEEESVDEDEQIDEISTELGARYAVKAAKERDELAKKHSVLNQFGHKKVKIDPEIKRKYSNRESGVDLAKYKTKDNFAQVPFSANAKEKIKRAAVYDETEYEGEPVDEMLRAPGKANQQVKSDKDTSSPMQSAIARTLKKKVKM